ncbi:MAG: isochorismatase family protein [Pseudomonadota bacterium]|nr:isochorismatase family protein [Pseudomonadota bacterium]
MGGGFTINATLEAVCHNLPLDLGVYDTSTAPVGLIIVDEVNGFATPNAGNLAPQGANAQITRMVAETDRLARWFLNTGRPVLAFLDTHEPGKPEPPYPPHCELGTGEEELVPALQWLLGEQLFTSVRKDCINGFVGAIDSESGENRLVDWVNKHQLDAIVAVGICTDICVMDFVLTILSARNHGLMPCLRDIVVFEPGCATYDMSKEAATAIGLPETAAHPQHVTHHLGLYFMASRGALLADELI